MIRNFNRSWKCYTTPGPEKWDEPREERDVDLPHDDNIRFDTAAGSISGAAGAYYPPCSTEYEKTLSVPKEWLDRRISLIFDGVYHNAVVRVNRQLAGRCAYGYTAFECDMTPYLHEGRNQIRVSAINGDVPNSRWYTGTGIYRGVQLWVQERVLIPWRGIRLETSLPSPGTARLNARVTVFNTDTETAVRRVRVTLSGDDRQTVSAEETVSAEAGKSAEILLTLDVPAARLWTAENPFLYHVRVELLDGNRTAETRDLSYGLRTIGVDPERGLLLNGQPVKLRGGCIHHDNGIIGAVSHPSAEMRRVRLLKKYGFNAIRSAHNPASEALLSACDTLGMYVLDEAFDMWNEPKMPYDNSSCFPYTWKNDVAAMVGRDRNHACVILYSTGNEVPERDGRCKGAEVSAALANEFRRLDPTRPVTHALCNVTPEGVNGIDANLEKDDRYFAEATAAVAEPLDIVGYNYLPDRFEKDRKRFPGRVFCATETVGSDLAKGWGMVEKHPWVIGDFVWTAMDYLGESGVGRTVVGSSPWGLADYPYRASGCGALDLAGRPRAAAWYRMCVWGVASRPYIGVEDPELIGKEVHVAWWGWYPMKECWNYPGHEKQLLTVHVYSTGDKVELYLNNRLIGTAPAGKAADYTADFSVPYESGELTAVVLNDGHETGRHTLRTPGGERILSLSADQQEAEGDALIYVQAQLTDKNGNAVFDDDRTVTFSAAGPLHFIAAGNTAIQTTANYAQPVQRLYEGHVMAVFRTTGKSGTGHIHCLCEGLEPAELVVRCTGEE